MDINRIVIKDIGPFAGFEVQFSPGLNVVLGDNGTGKTYLLKALYAAVAITTGEGRENWFERKLPGVFGLERRLNLVRRGQPFAEVQVSRSDDVSLGITIPAKGLTLVAGESAWKQVGIESVFIPSEDVTAHAPGFLSTVAKREIAFDDTYADLLIKAFLPPLKTSVFAEVLAGLKKVIGGEVIVEGERFYLKVGRSKQDFALVSEGVRRLALLWLLIRNGAVRPGTVLFWDAPETGLNYGFQRVVASAIAELASAGVQVFVTTNSLFLLREFEIEASNRQQVVRYINLHKTESGVRAEQAGSPAEVGMITALEESLLQSDRYMDV